MRSARVGMSYHAAVWTGAKVFSAGHDRTNLSFRFLDQVTILIAEDNLPMKTDTYTKVALTIIAFMLTLIACRSVVAPDKTVAADGPFAGVQFSGAPGIYFFDNKTGDIWLYDDLFRINKPRVLRYKLAKLGDPLILLYDSRGKNNK